MATLAKSAFSVPELHKVRVATENLAVTTYAFYPPRGKNFISDSESEIYFGIISTSPVASVYPSGKSGKAETPGGGVPRVPGYGCIRIRPTSNPGNNVNSQGGIFQFRMSLHYPIQGRSGKGNHFPW
eukprot:387881-Rhodomonas_salina.1